MLRSVRVEFPLPQRLTVELVEDIITLPMIPPPLHSFSFHLAIKGFFLTLCGQMEIFCDVGAHESHGCGCTTLLELLQTGSSANLGLFPLTGEPVPLFSDTLVAWKSRNESAEASSYMKAFSSWDHKHKDW